MTRETKQTASYEALYKELMGKPIPREGFVFPKGSVDVLPRRAKDIDPYERWLQAQKSPARRDSDRSE